MSKRECVVCKVNGYEKMNRDWFMLALERPYANLYVHLDCLYEITYDAMEEFLSKNYEKWKDML